MTAESTAEAQSLDESRMRLALDEAKRAAAKGDVPVGAVVVDAHGEVIARGHNVREAERNPVGHAEIIALREAARAVGAWRLERTTLYVTLEPCAMCAGALVNSRVARVVFGSMDPKAGALETLFRIGRDERLNHQFEVTSGVLAAESTAMLRAFFAELRSNRQR